MIKCKNELWYFLFFIVISVLVHGMVYWVSTDSYSAYFLSVIFFAAPFALYSCVQITLKKHNRLTGRVYSPKDKTNKVLYNFYKNRTFYYAFCIIISCLLGFVVPVFLVLLSKSEYFTIITLLPVILLTMFLVRKHYANNPFYDENHQHKNEVLSQRIIGIIFVICSLIYGFLYYFFLTKNFDQPLISNNPFNQNKIAFTIACILNNFETIPLSFVTSKLSYTLSFPFYVILAGYLLSGGIIFYFLSCFFQAFFLGKARLSTIFIPVENLVKKQHKKSWKILSLFFSWFAIVVLLFSLLAYHVTAKPENIEFIDDKTTLLGELIDNTLYKIGTSEKIEKLVGKIINVDTKEELKIAINTYFDEMITNTDSYLDHYYSLGAEYKRLGLMLWESCKNLVNQNKNGELQDSALDNNFEEYLNNTMQEKITPDYNLEEKTQDILNSGWEKVKKASSLILEQNRITHRNGKWQACIKTNLNDICKNAVPETFGSPYGLTTARVASSAVLGFATGIITKKLVQKLSGKLTHKLAIEVISETGEKVVKKTLLGTAIGSIAPGIGNIVGFLAGTILGIGVDVLSLKLEEIFNREEYRADIISCIEEERREYLENLNLVFQNY